MRRTRAPKNKEARAYQQMWRVVDGALRQCFNDHPEYLPSGANEYMLRTSISKRVVGSLLGFAAEAARHRSSTPRGGG